jgi:hypothetical protein
MRAQAGQEWLPVGPIQHRQNGTRIRVNAKRAGPAVIWIGEVPPFAKVFLLLHFSSEAA